MAFIATGRNAVIAAGTGRVTHHTPIQSTVPQRQADLEIQPGVRNKCEQEESGTQ